jgi:hypothetical protein
MKFLLLSFFLITLSCQKKEVEPAAVSAVPSGIIEEDCDTKAKKKIEIKEETIDLTKGTEGCSIDEMK